MNHEQALAVHDEESLRQFLLDHKRKSDIGLANAIDYVGVDENFRILTVYFKTKQEGARDVRPANL